MLCLEEGCEGILLGQQTRPSETGQGGREEVEGN